MIRRARVTDLIAIHRLVNEFAAQGLMLPISVGDVTERLRDFLVDERGGEIVGTVAVHVTWGRLVELRSLAVRKDFQGRGLGKRLVQAALREARALGADSIFTLTYVPRFFVQFGFKRVNRSQLPQKVWTDCVNCVKFPDCGEVPLQRALTHSRAAAPALPERPNTGAFRASRPTARASAARPR